MLKLKSIFNSRISNAYPDSLEDRPEHSSSNPLSVHALTVAYQAKPVLWDVDFDAQPKSLVAIVGPNGAGKSTFIKACLGLIPSGAGLVEFWGQKIDLVRNKISYVPQRESIDWDFPVSVIDVVAMGLYSKIGWCKPVRKKHLEEASFFLEQVGMQDYSRRQINQLSGGQQQRVFLARSLAQQADLYFMDEPFAGVDASTEHAIINVLRNMRDLGKTVICVHHDLVSVPEYFDSVVLLNTRKIADGLVSEVFNEVNLKKTFGGKLTLLDEISNAIARAGV
jgi:manganese/zinc/iron transport system ATP- binding protein